jgi:hypothetical protein
VTPLGAPPRPRNGTGDITVRGHASMSWSLTEAAWVPTAVESLFTEGFLSSFVSHTDSIGNKRYKTILTENKPSDLFGF